MTGAAPQACLVCGGSNWIPLPDPSSSSMTSDWRVVHEPLGRLACEVCGLVRRTPSTSTGSAFYTSGYSLYAHSPDETRERARQAAYARWIVDSVGSRPQRVLDVGCGNGSLLRALRSQWPEATLLGCDPSAESVSHGAGTGLHMWVGTANDLPADLRADVVVAVNVIEHTVDPNAFLVSLGTALAPDGRLVIVCPDGGRPGLDLLFVDHVFSFGRDHLHALVQRAGLETVTRSTAPDDLGAFQMVIGRQAKPADRGRMVQHAVPVATHVEASRAYLERWQHLDDRLEPRIPGSGVCFGAGEAAGLLRAYAPRTWRRMRACTVDGVSQGTFGELPMIPLESVGADETVLVGVRPQDQRRVAERLAARVARVVTWYDLVDGDNVGR